MRSIKRQDFAFHSNCSRLDLEKFHTIFDLTSLTSIKQCYFIEIIISCILNGRMTNFDRLFNWLGNKIFVDTVYYLKTNADLIDVKPNESQINVWFVTTMIIRFCFMDKATILSCVCLSYYIHLMADVSFF